MMRMADDDNKPVTIITKGTTTTMAEMGQDKDNYDGSLQQSNQTLESNNQQ